LAIDFKIPLHKIPSHIDQLLCQLNGIKKEISNKREQYNQMVKEYGTTIEELKEFRSKKHFLHKLNDFQQMLNNKNDTISLATKELKDFAIENEHLKAILSKDDILPNEFKEANKKLLSAGENKSLDKKELDAIIYELYHYPSDHIDIIKIMRQWDKQRNIKINNQE
jgi:protein subunit release factor A